MANRWIAFKEWFLHPQGIHPIRWRMITLWILIFSGYMIWTTIQSRNTDNSIRQEAITRKQERDRQVALLATAVHAECVKAFNGMSAILRVSINPKQINQLPADRRDKVKKIFSIADPKKNCPPPSVNQTELEKLRNNKG